MNGQIGLINEPLLEPPLTGVYRFNPVLEMAQAKNSVARFMGI